MTAENITTAAVTAVLAQKLGIEKHPALWGGKLRMQHSYWDDDLDQNSTVKIAVIPAGATIVGFAIVHEAFGAAVVGQIGDEDDADRYVAAGGITTMVAAGTQFVLPRQGDVTESSGVRTAGTVGCGFITTEETTLIMKLTGADMDGSDHRMDIFTIYAVE